MQRLGRFARYWDLIGNSGRFVEIRALILGDAPFARFLRVSDWLFARTRQTHAIAIDRLFDLVADVLIEELGVAADVALPALSKALQSENEWVRVQALNVVDELGPKAAPIRAAVEALKPDKGEYVKRLVDQILAR